MRVKGEGKSAKFRLLEREKEKGAQKDALQLRLHLKRRWGKLGASGPVSKAVVRKVPNFQKLNGCHV